MPDAIERDRAVKLQGTTGPDVVIRMRSAQRALRGEQWDPRVYESCMRVWVSVFFESTARSTSKRAARSLFLHAIRQHSITYEGLTVISTTNAFPAKKEPSLGFQTSKRNSKQRKKR